MRIFNPKLQLSSHVLSLRGENRRLQKRSFCGGSQGRKEFYA